jgi:hypothetical protein
MKASVVLVAALGMVLPAVAQDYKLPPSMQGRAAPSKPEGADYRLPGSAPPKATSENRPRPFGAASVKIIGLQCIVQNYRYGIATGEVENVSGAELRNVEVSVSWGRTRAKTQVISHIAAGKKASFHSEANVAGGSDCQVTVSAR